MCKKCSLLVSGSVLPTHFGFGYRHWLYRIKKIGIGWILTKTLPGSYFSKCGFLLRILGFDSIYDHKSWLDLIWIVIILNFKRLYLNLDHERWLSKGLIQTVITNPANFLGIWEIFTNESSWILLSTTYKQNESTFPYFRIWICEFESLNLTRIMIMNPKSLKTWFESWSRIHLLGLLNPDLQV